MVKKLEKFSIEELTKNEISALETSDKISKLEKELARDKKIIAEYKEREKASARALVLYERKINYLKSFVIENVLTACKQLENLKHIYSDDDKLETDKNALVPITESLYDVCNKFEANAVITKQDRAFISNEKIKEVNAGDTSSRFDRLKQEFNQKIGASVLRKPGRPKKEDQSILADIGLRKKVEKVVDENDDTMSKISELFYEAPTTTSVVSNIPQTSDSIFDFNEALNPNISLKDIMADIMSDKEDEPAVTYNEDNLEENILQNKEKIQMLESGIIKNPIITKKVSANISKKEDAKVDTKKTSKKGFVSFNDLL